jgi:hypothetical protein
MASKKLYLNDIANFDPKKYDPHVRCNYRDVHGYCKVRIPSIDYPCSAFTDCKDFNEDWTWI